MTERVTVSNFPIKTSSLTFEERQNQIDPLYGAGMDLAGSIDSSLSASQQDAFTLLIGEVLPGRFALFEDRGSCFKISMLDEEALMLLEEKIRALQEDYYDIQARLSCDLFC